tara:strand:+ start:342 stop:527 length:186 start_codon:yes stop_codon:yes gene_type:complete
MKKMGKVPNIWVNVNHRQRQITFFENDGGPFNGDGSYMSMGYFNVYSKSMDIEGYKINEKK